jgi:ABC-type iron transport system FetAB permease component
MTPMTDEARRFAAEEERSLDFVQRLIASSAIAAFIGSLAIVLAAYLAASGVHELPRDSVIGLWIMTGVIGLVTAAAVLVLHRRHWYSPFVLIGLLPMAASAYWIL